MNADAYPCPAPYGAAFTLADFVADAMASFNRLPFLIPRATPTYSECYSQVVLTSMESTNQLKSNPRSAALNCAKDLMNRCARHHWKNDDEGEVIIQRYGRRYNTNWSKRPLDWLTAMRWLETALQEGRLVRSYRRRLRIAQVRERKLYGH